MELRWVGNKEMERARGGKRLAKDYRGFPTAGPRGARPGARGNWFVHRRDRGPDRADVPRTGGRSTRHHLRPPGVRGPHDPRSQLDRVTRRELEAKGFDLRDIRFPVVHRGPGPLLG